MAFQWNLVFIFQMGEGIYTLFLGRPPKRFTSTKCTLYLQNVTCIFHTWRYFSRFKENEYLTISEGCNKNKYTYNSLHLCHPLIEVALLIYTNNSLHLCHPLLEVALLIYTNNSLHLCHPLLEVALLIYTNNLFDFLLTPL